MLLNAPVNGHSSPQAEKRFENNAPLLRIADKADEEKAQFSLEEVAKIFDVTTETIYRWQQKRGLQSTKVGGKKVCTREMIDEFYAQNRELVEHARQCSRISEDERNQILTRARQKAREGMSPSKVIQCVAQMTERHIGTIRDILNVHDQENPTNVIFTPEANQTPDQHRYGRIRAMSLSFKPSPEFSLPDAETTILAPMPVPEKPARRIKPPKDMPAYLQALYEHPVLTRDQEVHLFRQYNYLKYKAVQLFNTLNPQNPNPTVLEKIESLLMEATNVHNHIVVSNLRLVVSIMKKYVTNSDDLMEMVSDGNRSLEKAVEGFDFTRGFKFSTYATRAIKQNRNTDYQRRQKRAARERVPGEEIDLDTFSDQRSSERDEEERYERLKTLVRDAMEHLNRRERDVICRRYGLERPKPQPGETTEDDRESQAHEAQKGASEPQTLKEAGEELGLTKERVRQIEARAMQKLRAALREADGEMSEMVDEVNVLPSLAQGKCKYRVGK